MKNLTDEQAGMLIKLIGEYSNYLTQNNPNNPFDPQTTQPLVLGIFMAIKRDFDIQNENYLKIVERNRLNSKKGGAKIGNQNARKQPNGNHSLPMEPKTTQNNPNNLKDKDKDKDKDNYNILDSSIENLEFDMFSNEAQNLADNYLKIKYKL